MIKKPKTILLFLAGMLFLTSCRNDLIKLRNSARMTEAEIKLFKGTIQEIEEATGISKFLKEKAIADSIATSDLAPIGQKHMLNKYGYIYDMINGSSGEQIHGKDFRWDPDNNEYYLRNKSFKRIRPENEVFGWHPYWMGNLWMNYPFELLSSVSYFSYVLDPETGGYQNPGQMKEWMTTAMVDSAKAKDTRVLLTISSHGAKNNDKFLSNKGAWTALEDTVFNLLLARGADGVDLNFESLPYSKRGRFNRFVKKFHNSMNDKFESEMRKEFYLSITLPAVDSREIFDIDELDKYADLFIIMGYDYHSESQEQGAVAPLRSSEGLGISLRNTLDFYTTNDIDRSKTILALPYYGSMWAGNIQNRRIGVVNSSQFERKVTYREIKELIIDNEEFVTESFLDEISMTNYFNLTFPKDSSEENYPTKEIWFDDDYTLGKKYDYAMSRDLTGIGMWALGYDNGHSELWDVIEDKFSTDEIVVEDPIARSEGFPLRISTFLYKYRDLFVVAFVCFIIAIVIGFVILLGDWRIRDSLIRNQLHRLIFVLIIFVLLAPIVAYLNEVFFLKANWRLYAAFILGVLTLYISSKFKINPIVKP